MSENKLFVIVIVIVIVIKSEKLVNIVFIQALLHLHALVLSLYYYAETHNAKCRERENVHFNKPYNYCELELKEINS